MVEGNNDQQAGESTEWRYVDEALEDAMPNQRADLRKQVEWHLRQGHISSLKADRNFVAVEVSDNPLRKNTEVYVFRTATGAGYFVKAVVDLCRKLEARSPVPSAAA